MSHSTPPSPNDEVHAAPSRAPTDGGNAIDAPAVDALPAPGLAGLELGSQIADGLCSRVYRAKTTTAEGYDETVAVKVWKPEAKVRTPTKPLGAVLSALKHVNVVRHISEGTTLGGAPYLVMEHAGGQTLEALLKHGPIEVSRAVGLSRQLARALVALHGANLVHGDLKPNHVLIVEDERYEDLLKLCDVGGKPLDWVKTSLGETAWLKRRSYLAPEQLQDETVTPRSDLYSAGMILFEMLTGSAPTEDQPATKLVSLLPRYVPRALKDVVLRLIQKEPTLRFSSAEQWLTALDQIDGRNQDEDEFLSSSPRSAFIASGMSRTAPPGSVRPASSIRKAPWGLESSGFKLWAVACGLAACGAAGIVGYRMYTHAERSAESPNQDTLGQTTNAQVSALQGVAEILRVAPESRSAEQWLTLSTHFLDTAQLEQAERVLELAVKQQPSLIHSARADAVVRRLGERQSAFMSRLENDATQSPEVRSWAREHQLSQ